MFIIEVLKALMRRLLIAGKRMIKVLPDEIRDGEQRTVNYHGGTRESLARLVPLCFPSISSVPCAGDF